MDYFSILDLNKEPFSNSPDPEFFFHSRQHLDCLQKLELSLLLRRGLNVVIGDVGTGKTTLCRQLIRRFAQKKEMETYLILDPHFLYASEFLATVAKLLTGKKPRAGSHDWQIKEYIKQYLFRKGVDQGKTVVLIIDEGQKIPAFCLEILREFLNYETNDFKLLQIVIFAQREFEKTIRKYPNFSDRINLYHLLKPLSFPDTRRMIQFRLDKSSNSPKKLNLFTYPALWAIFRISGGYPRKIINLCHQSILSMIIQNRSRSNFFLVRKCARRVFTEKSRRWKILVAAALMSGAIAVVLTLYLPSDRFNLGPFQKIAKVKAGFFLNPSLEIPDPISKAEILRFKARIRPGNFDTQNPRKAKMLPLSPDPAEEPPAPASIQVKASSEAERTEAIARPKTEIYEEKAPMMALVDRVIDNAKAELPPAPTYASILGRITLKRKETLSWIIGQVYGEFNDSYLKSFIIANPNIKNPHRVEVGQIIALPAIPVDVLPGNKRVLWLKIGETDTLEAAFRILRNHPDDAPPVRLIPHWNAVDGTKFSVVLARLFKDGKSARSQQQQLPSVLSSGSTILAHWNEQTVFFANPYFDGGGTLNSTTASRAARPWHPL